MIYSFSRHSHRTRSRERKSGRIFRNVVLIFVYAASVRCYVSAENAVREKRQTHSFDVRMNSAPSKAEQYMKANTVYTGQDAYVTGIDLVDVEPDLHHHMGLYLTPPGGHRRLLFIWAHGAPGLRFPSNSGYPLPKGSKLMLETHFLGGAVGKKQRNGFRLLLTRNSPQRIAQIASMEVPQAQFNIPPRSQGSVVQTSCRLRNGPVQVHSVMIHTHGHGTEVAFFRRDSQSGSGNTIYAGDPQLPQQFNSITPVALFPDDVLTLRCKYDTMTENVPVHYGVGRNEMCGTYFVYTGAPFDCRSLQTPRRFLKGMQTGARPEKLRDRTLRTQTRSGHRKGQGNKWTYYLDEEAAAIPVYPTGLKRYNQIVY